jgi:hypothetical protein
MGKGFRDGEARMAQVNVRQSIQFNQFNQFWTDWKLMGKIDQSL